ncbi:FAD-dependent monooxygenase [Actinophytocola sp.]|uniref:FAD-dependent monooxygenase n=1 Tax=Actinophytocola sp. TaxID=1872138 RepID=UPI00389A0351
MRVLVAGGGIGGLALAVALRRAGIAVTVVERAARIAHAGAGLVLGPNSIVAVDAISPRLGSTVRSIGHVAQSGQVRPIVDPAGTVLATDPIGELSERFGAPQVSLLRSALQAALFEEAVASGADLRLGVSLDAFTDHGDGVTALLSDGTPLRGTVLVGADGINSRVRQALLGDGPPRYCGYTSVRARTAAPAAYPHGVVAGGEHVHLFCAPIGRGQVYWTAKVTAPVGVWPAMTATRAHAAVVAELAGWHPVIRNMVADTGPDVLVTDVADRDPVPQWTFGRVTLLGDAAHPMSPSVGQGAGMALEDAVVLAANLRDHHDPTAALTAYNAVRAPRTAQVVQLSRRDRTVSYEGGENQRFTELYGWRAA